MVLFVNETKNLYKPRLRIRIVCNTILLILWLIHLYEYKLRLMVYVINKTMAMPTVGPNIQIAWDYHVNQKKLHDELPTNQRTQPNIILILADDLGINDLYGKHQCITSSIRSIGENGAIFNNAYAGHATCAPSRASLMTGKFPTRFGFEFTPVPPMMAHLLGSPNLADRNCSHAQNIIHREKLSQLPDMDEMTVPKEEAFLPEVLQQLGYRTFLFGKWHLGSTNNSKPINRGFNHTLGFLMGASHYSDPKDPNIEYSKIAGLKFDQFLWEKLPFAVSYNDGPLFTPDRYMTDYLAEEAAAAILATRSHSADHSIPFFVEVAFNAPHNPLVALQSDYLNPMLEAIKSHRERVYAAMILAVDRGVKTILTAVEEIGESDNTIIIFSSDNGGADYIGLYDINKPYRGWKATLFEGGIRVPLFIKWPLVIPRNTISDAVVSHVDLFTTALTVAGFVKNSDASIPSLDGIDLIDVLNHTLSGHEYLFWRSGHYKALRYFDWKIQVSAMPRKVWVYDLASDPTETRNYAEDISIDALNVWKTNRCFDDNMSKFALAQTSRVPIQAMRFQNQSTKLVAISKSKEEISSIGAINSHSPLLKRLQLACQLLRVLDAIDTDQENPLWPSVSETVVRIDEPSYLEGTSEGWNSRIGNEYIYWPN